MNWIKGATKDSHTGTTGKIGDGLSPDLDEEPRRAALKERRMRILRRKQVKLAHGGQCAPQPKNEQI